MSVTSMLDGLADQLNGLIVPLNVAAMVGLCFAAAQDVPS